MKIIYEPLRETDETYFYEDMHYCRTGEVIIDGKEIVKIYSLAGMAVIVQTPNPFPFIELAEVANKLDESFDRIAIFDVEYTWEHDIYGSPTTEDAYWAKRKQ